MTDQPLAIVVLAAGEGTRMRSGTPKVLHALAGRTMLGHVLALADALHAARTCIVLAADTLDQVRASAGPAYSYALQRERRGTGHAVLQARAALSDLGGLVLVLFGDTPLLRVETAAALVETMRRDPALVGLLSFHANPPTGYGRVLRDGRGRVVDLIEERSATPEQRLITEANSGVMAFQGPWLWQRIADLQPNPVKQEYYLTDMVALAVRERGPGAALALTADDPREAWGVNDQAQLAQAAAALRERINAALLQSGVTMPDPSAVYVDVGVRVSPGATLLPGTCLQGNTQIAAGALIGPNVTLHNTTVGAGARVRDAVVEDMTLADGADVGPFVHLRGSAAE